LTSLSATPVVPVLTRIMCGDMAWLLEPVTSVMYCSLRELAGTVEGGKMVVGLGVKVGVRVAVGVKVGVRVTVGVKVGVRVTVGVKVGVRVAVGVEVRVLTNGVGGTVLGSIPQISTPFRYRVIWFHSAGVVLVGS
jgi:hypothetical protein